MNDGCGQSNMKLVKTWRMVTEVRKLGVRHMMKGLTIQAMGKGTCGVKLSSVLSMSTQYQLEG